MRVNSKRCPLEQNFFRDETKPVEIFEPAALNQPHLASVSIALPLINHSISDTYWLGGFGDSSCFTSGPSPEKGQFLSNNSSFSRCSFDTLSVFRFSRT